MKKLTANVDFDWAIYRACYSDKTLDEKIELVNWFVAEILEKTECNDRRLFLTVGTNFRYKLFPEYKAARKDKPKPDHFFEVREYIIGDLKAESHEDFEADDLCAMHQTDDTILVAEDKDTLMVPGKHYRIKKKWEDNYFLTVTPDMGNLAFWVQMCAGDHTDGIDGIKNPDKAHHKKPPNFSTEVAEELLKDKPEWIRREIVMDLYRKQFGDTWEQEFDLKGNLLFLKRSETDNFKLWI